MKNILFICLLSLISSAVFSLPQSALENTYYATSEKLIPVGYEYYSCIASGSYRTGYKTPFREQVILYPCGVGDSEGGRASCISDEVWGGSSLQEALDACP
ncbi:hypothetical protein ACCI51_15950 [Microbulbifer echini]|uniref:Uncharacterized protein n=1 Tax=Microbulbifer echini TaxID=1529067 RepID=A0ABV4NR54_9GAMM